MEPLEHEYYELVDGQMYPILTTQKNAKVDTVTPKYPTQEEHSG